MADDFVGGAECCPAMAAASRYFEYLKMASPLVSRYGAEVVYAGDGAPALAPEPGQAWDAVALVRYPNRRAFADMHADPDYQKADPVRMSALAEAVLQLMLSLTA